MNKHMAGVAAVVVTYNPDVSFVSRTQMVLEQVSEIIIVDNGSNAVSRQFINDVNNNSRVTLLDNKVNLGIAAALNSGIQLASVKGYDWVVTLDQDSVPCPGMLRAQMDVLSLEGCNEKLAVIAPNVLDLNARKSSPMWIAKDRWLPLFFNRRSCVGSESFEVDIVITSGALVNVAIYRHVGPFIEDLFIDYVDTEYCLRVRARGFKIVVACAAKLNHRLGESVEVIRYGLKRNLPQHSPIRYYYMSRNRLLMYKWYGLRFPHWFVFDLLSFIYSWSNILVFGTHRREKIKYLYLGMKDALRGRFGSLNDNHEV